MLIKNNNKTTKTKRSNKARKPTAVSSVKAKPDAWKEVRPEKVARAKKLLQNPGYPSGKVINSVARLLAKHLGK
jgi:hypothetical protein